MAGIYILAGLSHFIVPKVFLRIMPAYIPYHKEMVAISGAAEIILGIGLIVPATRTVSAWGVMLLLLAVFPANIEQVLRKKARMGLPLWLVILRLPLQFALIWWAWQYI